MNQSGSNQTTAAKPKQTHLLLFTTIMGGLVGASVVNLFSGNATVGLAGIALTAALAPVALRLRAAE